MPRSLIRVAVLAALVFLIAPRSECRGDDDTEAPLRLRKIVFSGQETFSARTLKGVLQLQPRPWYALWQQRPPLDETTLATDIHALERFYEARGFYGTRARYRLDTDDDSRLAKLRIAIEETSPVIVRDLQVLRDGEALSSEEIARLPPLPVTVGQPLVEEDYQAGEAPLRQFYLEHGHARVSVRRSATVDTHTRNARVVYAITPGPQAVFGTTSIPDDTDVDAYIIEREIQIEPGTPFHPQAIADARNRLLDLDLFRVVQVIASDGEGPPEVVDLRVRVEEKPPRSILIGVGYGTEEQFRARFAWSHRNFLGDARQLSFQARVSSIIASGTLLFVQPHLYSPKNTGFIEASHTQQNEDTFTVNATRVRPRFERRLTRFLTASLAYRVEQVFTTGVDEATRSAIGGIRSDGLITGPSLALIRNSVDDQLDPTRGSIVAATAEQYGKWWPGAFAYYKLAVDARRFVSLPYRFVFASRAEIATIEALGPAHNVPIHDRLYSGGDRSIRGFSRRRLGPASTTDRPLGGLSRLETSVELRRPIWGSLGGAVFVDAGLVSLKSYDLPLADIEPAAGFGFSYATPVGPLRLDLAFPFDPPSSKDAWRLHFSVGHFF